jgi:hypothetical protein
VSESYALDLLSLVESILEDPTPVLLRQSDKAKDEKMAEMKANGVPYEERIEELQKVEYPKPNAEFIHGAFAAFAERHPWVGGEDIRPKSVARDLFERLSSFGDYVVEYGLQRSEGVLLRYLSEVYRALTHTVPEAARDEAVEDVRTHLRELLRGVDSSLIDEWERLRSGGALPSPQAPLEAEPEPLKLPEDDPRVLAQNPKAFAARVRNELHRLLKAVATRSWGDALAAIHPLEGEPSWTPEALAQAMEPYFAEHPFVDLKPRSRLPHNTVLRPDGELRWEAIQKIVDPEGEADWMLDCIVDLGAARPEGAPLIALRRIGT